jgi:hypothetical protein
MSEKITRTFRMEVRVLGAKQSLGGGLGPGVVATQDVEFTATPEEFNSPMFIRELVERQDAFLKECVQVSVKEVE